MHAEDGVVIGHPGLTASANFWSPDGVHLNKRGMKTFISDIEEGLLVLMINRSTWVQMDKEAG